MKKINTLQIAVNQAKAFAIAMILGNSTSLCTEQSRYDKLCAYLGYSNRKN
jgi:hypothetical protein